MPRKKKAVNSTEEEVAAINETTAEKAVPATNPNQKEISLNDLRVAYVVGMTEEGDFVFQLLGKDPGLVELLGIHQHAVHRVQRIYEDKQVGGDRLVHEVGKSVAVLNQKIDHLLNIVAPKQPDNKLS